MSTRRGSPTQVAESVPFDPSNCEAITSENVQGAIDQLCVDVGVSASPGFSWGESGNVTANTWLVNDTVPSNKTGRNFPLYNGFIFEIAVANENSNTFDIEIYEHDGTTFTLLATVGLTAQRSDVFDQSDFGTVNITRGKELAAKLVNGSGKNVVIQLIAKGTETA